MINLIGGPYACPNYRARTRVVFQTKAMMSQYRAVGHPIATAVTEGLVDLAAASLGMDPAGDPPPQPDRGRRLSLPIRRPGCGSRGCPTTRAWTS